jgi:hypothetical protein
VLALAEEPVDVLLAFVAENTGCRLSACALPFEVFVAAAAEDVVPAPACTVKVPPATVLVAVAVVSAAAKAAGAASSARAATVAKSFFMSGFILI